MKIDIMTLFPDSMSAVLGESILGRAAKKGLIEINFHQIRDYTQNKQKQVDDYPYGGGWGCVMMAQPLYDCWRHVCAGERVHTIYMSPLGKVFTQADAKRLSSEHDRLVLVCGHYEGIDERFIEQCVDEEISIGDFVLTGGEIPAMALTDAVCRLLPGVLSDEECFTGESHWDGLLEYPQYTRPELWEGRRVPEVLLSGHHENIAKWRRKQSIIRTRRRRPDMYEKLDLSGKRDVKLLAEIENDKNPDGAIDIRLASASDLDGIMSVIGDAQKFMADSGLDQWQDGYPARENFEDDIEKEQCYVITHGGDIGGVFALVFGDEPCYADIHGGRWLSDGPYATVHRSALDSSLRGTGTAAKMLEFCFWICMEREAKSLRVDTHGDNVPMRGLMRKQGFTRCGAVYYPDHGGVPRVAYEKLV